jgi:hypothetical protein
MTVPWDVAPCKLDDYYRFHDPPASIFMMEDLKLEESSAEK